MPPVDPENTTSLAPRAQPGSGRAYLLVLRDDSSMMVPLPASGAVVLGRGPEADVRVDDKAASRRHAQVLMTGGTAEIQDLESHNGTRLNGDPVTELRRLQSGDVITIGEVALVFHSAAAAPARAVLEPAVFRQRLDEELERAAAYDRPLSLCAVRADTPAALAAMTTTLEQVLRIIDLVGKDTPTQILVLLPELDRDRAVELAEGITHHPSRVGVATFPDDGGDASALVAAARAAVAAGKPGGVSDATSGVTVIELGGRTVRVADPAMLRLYDLIRRVARSTLPVLITGETGAGKENAAFAVHHWSSRKDRPFVTVNSAALQDSLAESELFGYERGAFTGAVASKPGVLESADGGTVFLDEIGELSPAIQAKLLRALESGRVMRVGGVKERAIDLRIVAATHRSLEDDVVAGRFRQDLFFRLGAAVLVLPPLRDRPRDIAMLAHAFLDEACAAGGRAPMTISGAAMRALTSHAWPGNVRELKNAMSFAAATALDDALQPWHLSARIAAGPPADDPSPAAPDAPSGFRPLADELRELEQRRMREALEAAGGVQKHAAKLLAMPLRTFVMKVKQYGLKPR